MWLKIKPTIDGEPARINVTDEVASKYAEIKKEDSSLSDFDALKMAKQQIEGITILSKEESRAKLHELLRHKELETGKSQMEIFREMEYWLSQKDERSLTASGRAMLHALEKVDKQFYGDSNVKKGSCT
ncbi:hypothetical protein OU798_04470 [Prolixibacteraceae bacterium Z1-6]|uniref:Uncharacterized protein n=1 Tax=Draconibacterium aestuarii TaxID=2998507 RepID=A0A9X3J5L7_9BACT|nr:hypothetical protein [Prolixibacteraceae bacterium Z1-6]